MNVENTGQIQLTGAFGQWIAKYAADSRFHRYVEIGTWNGRGSTCCFYAGFRKRSDAVSLQSYEVSKDRATEARGVWTRYPAIRVIHGRMLLDSECPTLEEVCAVHPEINPEWHAEDIGHFWSCKYVPMNDPQVILLDGAEYLTWFEFKKMIVTTTASVYLLDDTRTAKCPKILAWFAEHPEWVRVAGDDADRNGWAIYERKPHV